MNTTNGTAHRRKTGIPKSEAGNGTDKSKPFPGDISNGLEALRQSLSRYSLALTGSSWDADDLQQDVWVKALSRGPAELAGHPNPEALLLRIARNAWTDRCRRLAVHRRAMRLEQASAQPDAPGAEAAAGEAEAALQALARHCSPLQLAVFLLRGPLGLSAAETAQALRTSEGAVKAALHRARAALPGVRRELRAADGPDAAAPAERDAQALVRALAAAYAAGDVPLVARLALGDAAYAQQALGALTARLAAPGRSAAAPAGAALRPQALLQPQAALQSQAILQTQAFLQPQAVLARTA